MNDDFGTWLICMALSFLFWPFLIPVVLIVFLVSSAVFTVFLGSVAVALGGIALIALIAIAAFAGIVILTVIGIIIWLITGGKNNRPPTILAVGSLLITALISALVFYYYPVHPIRTPAEDVSYIRVTDESGEHVIDFYQNVEIYMRDLNNLRMHRSFRTVTDQDAKDHAATMTLYDADGQELATFQMLDDTWFSIQRAKTWESFKAYTILGEMHDYKDFIKIYEDNELHNQVEAAYEQFDAAFREFEASLSADGTQLHFRIPVVEDTDSFSVRVTEIYYKEPEPGKVNNRAVDKIYDGYPDDYWVEGQDYWLELAGKQYYSVDVLFGCGGAAKEYHVLGLMPDELKRPRKLDK